ncbi:hypothetical protein PM03_06145 [Thalassobacter stenotrophicus]|uniref:DUF3306 domain-containing protein n=1 Tax=Thalassobacter TaxID=266808 RepID=UPI00051D04C1|nr:MULTISPECIES: DUF3306 domain-containing protein [Thalassobacter]KGK80242.1 hypothetical protein PM03_06145 [Thalassobacter stenotrophicus]KGL01128.1 hypothetical protein PM04_10435 [Thalassobacter sp. 16PALIMAR09]
MMRSWSDRKAAVAAEAQAEVAAEEAAQVEAFEAEQAERTDAEILEELGLPDPDTLEEGADFKGFLNKNVPERIKTRALRRLWRLNPVLANVDGLVDYGEDYTDAACVIEGMQTAYQVGKGMLKHIEALAEQSEADAAAPEVAEADAEDTLEDVTGEATDPVAPAEDTPAPVYSAADVLEDDAAAVAPPLWRRMKFTFEETA